MDKYGLIGFPLEHSFSKSFFNEKFNSEKIDAQYINFEIPAIETLPEIIASNPELKGLNVTIPYKQKVISYLDSVSPEARAIGAVNVIRVEQNGNETLLKGYNSDVIGSLGLETVFVSRYERPGTIQYNKITPDIVNEYNVIINCTPCGMFPHIDECPQLPYEAMNEDNILYDLIYNPDQTLFMQKGEKQGATVKNGLEMLLLQAFASWDFWNGQE